MHNILFVCVENSCRSQMAEGFGKQLGQGLVAAYSSGSRPSGKVNEKAVLAMQGVGYDLTKHRSKSLQDIPQIQYDYVITMGCGDACPHIQSHVREDWDIPDPKHMEMDQFNEIRDVIKSKVKQLIDGLRE